MKPISYITLLWCILFGSCAHSLSDKDITKHVWKAGTPCGLGDVIIFGKTQEASLKNDTIFHKGTPIALIVKKDYNMFTDTKMSLINLQDTTITDTCVYHAK